MKQRLTCIAETNSLKPRNPCRLTSAIAHTWLKAPHQQYIAHYNIEPEMRHPKGQQLGATRAHQTKLHQQYHILASQSSDWLHKFTLFNSVRFPAWHQALLINVDNLEENYLLQFCLGQLRQGEKLDSIVASETSIVICESRMKIYKSSYPDSYNWAILKVLKYEA
jgi:hypothetical protein